jgi:hypothetical protein
MEGAYIKGLYNAGQSAPLRIQADALIRADPDISWPDVVTPS